MHNKQKITILKNLKHKKELYQRTKVAKPWMKLINYLKNLFYSNQAINLNQLISPMKLIIIIHKQNLQHQTFPKKLKNLKQKKFNLFEIQIQLNASRLLTRQLRQHLITLKTIAKNTADYKNRLHCLIIIRKKKVIQIQSYYNNFHDKQKIKQLSKMQSYFRKSRKIKYLKNSPNLIRHVKKLAIMINIRIIVTKKKIL